MNFFLDANISRRLANMIAALEEGNHQVIHITQHQRVRRGKLRG